ARAHAPHLADERRAREALVGAPRRAVVAAREARDAALDLDLPRGRDRRTELALRPLHAQRPVDLLDGDAGGDRHGPASDARHHQTSQSSSPPTRASRPARSASTPLQAESTAIPRPLRTRGTPSLPTCPA